ncbi:hypothetical protein BX600DRAFT_464746 [Xylariales sp. PMI_506]|nr:hypothetical protein BX600DRAFT_464746 [Xylariales sp. PMI_506]
MAEVTSGVLCAAIPTIRPLFIRYFPNVDSTSRSRTSYEMYDVNVSSRKNNLSVFVRGDVHIERYRNPGRCNIEPIRLTSERSRCQGGSFPLVKRQFGKRV